MLNFFRKKDENGNKSLEERVGIFSKKLSREYGDRLPPHYPGMQSLKKIVEGKETYTSGEVIQSLADEEIKFFQGEYLQCLKALRRRGKTDYSSEELPKTIEEGLKKIGHGNTLVFREVYDTNVFSPVHKAIRELEKSRKVLNKGEAYEIMEKVNTEILNNEFKGCLKSIARRL